MKGIWILWLFAAVLLWTLVSCAPGPTATPIPEGYHQECLTTTTLMSTPYFYPCGKSQCVGVHLQPVTHTTCSIVKNPTATPVWVK